MTYLEHLRRSIRDAAAELAEHHEHVRLYPGGYTTADKVLADQFRGRPYRDTTFCGDAVRLIDEEGSVEAAAERIGTYDGMDGIRVQLFYCLFSRDEVFRIPMEDIKLARHYGRFCEVSL